MQRSSCRVRCGIRRRLLVRRRTCSPSRDGRVRSRLGGGLAYCRLSIATALVGTCSRSYRWIFAILVTREAGSLAGLPLLVSCSKLGQHVLLVRIRERRQRFLVGHPFHGVVLCSYLCIGLVCLEKEEV